MPRRSHRVAMESPRGRQGEAMEKPREDSDDPQEDQNDFPGGTHAPHTLPATWEGAIGVQLGCNGVQLGAMGCN